MDGLFGGGVDGGLLGRLPTDGLRLSIDGLFGGGVDGGVLRGLSPGDDILGLSARTMNLSSPVPSIINRISWPGFTVMRSGSGLNLGSSFF
jgi:hypothetical protein